MPNTEPRQLLRRTGRLEPLEVRQVMSSNPLGGTLGGIIQHHTIFETPPPVHGGQLDQHLASAHGQSGLVDVQSDYGFLGAGQTVAIIDSGIAYDHPALGGGLGASFRVVGGYDFTGEQDANPYDDGPFGSHGTHVAGIVGADGGTTATSGVAPAVDLVALRVFDDDGDGYFSWIEDSLQWVLANRNAFENPITTVNISIGTDYNGSTPPNWSMLEDEFAQLEAAGVFIAVSAGNSFDEYNEQGLSYPAASPYVVPVMSTDDNGSLSSFSQRHPRAIAAPGRWIVSTVPDYIGNHNGQTDDWASFSGTSMAAPYLAGASVLIREAMQFVGYTGITQDTIYQHIRATADIFHDAATGANYHRLNLDAAIDALMPDDDYGSTVATAYALGDLGTPGGPQQASQIAGLIGTLSDADYFTFTAGASGSVAFTANTTHNLAAAWQVDGASGNVSGPSGETVTFDVVAGEAYTVGLSTSDGIGYYELTVSHEASFAPIDWGAVTFAEHVGVDNSAGESWYQVQAGNSGSFTVETLFDAAVCDVDLQVYDAQMNLIGQSTTGGGSERVDVLAGAGDMLYVRLSGAHNSVDVRLTNLVRHDGATVFVAGTDADDEIRVTLGQTHTVEVNGVTYSFAAQSATHFDVHAGSGWDRIDVTGTAADESAVLRVGELTFTGGGVTLTAEAFDLMYLVSGGGTDEATFYDSSANDRYQTTPQYAAMFNATFYNRADGFAHTFGHATAGGHDEARMYDSAGNDLYQTWSGYVLMFGDGYFNRAHGFEYTRGFATAGGHDEARMYDTPGNDLYQAWSNRSALSGTGFYHVAEGFEVTRGLATYGGKDEARFYDTPGNDLFVARKNLSTMTGAGYHMRAEGFDIVQAFATSGGTDEARFYDTPGNERFLAYAGDAVMSGGGYWHRGIGFDVTIALAYEGGHDEVRMFDSPGNDLYQAWSNKVSMNGPGFVNWAGGFDVTIAIAYGGGYDEVRMYDSPGNDLFQTWSNKTSMNGPGFVNWAGGFERMRGFAIYGGSDEVRMYDSVYDDLFQTWHNRAVMNGPGYFCEADGFEYQRGFSTAGGNDQARIYDTAADEHLQARVWGAYLEGGAYRAQAVGFAAIAADGTAGGVNTSEVDAVDYAFQLVGQWT